MAQSSLVVTLLSTNGTSLNGGNKNLSRVSMLMKRSDGLKRR